MLCTIFYSLVELYQKTHSFAALTRSFSDTTQLVNKNHTRQFPWSNLYISARQREQTGHLVFNQQSSFSD